MTARVKVLAFAGARDVLGAAEIDLVLATASATAGQVMEELCRRHPALAPWRRALRVAVNGSYAGDADPVRDGDEVALIPPVAGG
jgi:molybdopterin converting factor subunit 1